MIAREDCIYTENSDLAFIAFGENLCAYFENIYLYSVT